MNASRPPILIAVAVVIADGRVLVGRRPSDVADAAGRAEFPGGKVEAGESPEQAAARECREESGVEVRVNGLLDVVTAPSTLGPVEIHFHAAEPIDPEGAVDPPFAWVPIGQLVASRFPAANAGVIARLMAGRSGR